MIADQIFEIDVCKLQFFYQGCNFNDNFLDYNRFFYRFGFFILQNFSGNIGGGGGLQFMMMILLNFLNFINGNGGGGGSCVVLYGQCGGLGFIGLKCCFFGICKYSNDWYLQCL